MATHAPTLAWVNQVLGLKMNRIQDAFKTHLFCQLLDAASCCRVPMHKVRWEPRADHEHIENLRVFQDTLVSMNIEKHLDIPELSTGKFQESILLIQWIQKLHKTQNAGAEPYDAVTRRNLTKGLAPVKKKAKAAADPPPEEHTPATRPALDSEAAVPATRIAVAPEHAGAHKAVSTGPAPVQAPAPNPADDIRMLQNAVINAGDPMALFASHPLYPPGSLMLVELQELGLTDLASALTIGSPTARHVPVFHAQHHPVEALRSAMPSAPLDTASTIMSSQPLPPPHERKASFVYGEHGNLLVSLPPTAPTRTVAPSTSLDRLLFQPPAEAAHSTYLTPRGAVAEEQHIPVAMPVPTPAHARGGPQLPPTQTTPSKSSSPRPGRPERVASDRSGYAAVAPVPPVGGRSPAAASAVAHLPPFHHRANAAPAVVPVAVPAPPPADMRGRGSAPSSKSPAAPPRAVVSAGTEQQRPPGTAATEEALMTSLAALDERLAQLQHRRHGKQF